MKRNSPCYFSCGGTFAFWFSKNGFAILRCSICHLHVLETDDQSYDQFLSQYYSEGYFKGKDDKFGYADYLAEEDMIRKNAQGYLRSIHTLVPRGELLDVGCAAGFFMREAENLGFSVHGLDTSQYITQLAAPDLQKKIICSPLHKADLPSQFYDIVIMFDLIEHLADPKTDLTHIHKSMKDNGLIVIGTGDIDSIYAHLLRTHNHYFAPPHHLFFFSRRSIKTLLEQCGFTVEKIEWKGKWLTFPYIARVAKHFNIPFLEWIMNSALIHKLLWNRWFYLFFGDNMVVYARKNNS